LPSKVSRNPSKKELRCLTLNHQACNILVDAYCTIMNSNDGMFVDAHDVWTRIKMKYFKFNCNVSTSSHICATKNLKEEEERCRPNDESMSSRGSISHSALHAFANIDDRENEIEDVEEDEIHQLCAHLNKEQKAILMKLLRRIGNQRKTLLKLEETLIETKENLEKLSKEHEELKCSHGDLVQMYESILIVQTNNENALSCIAQIKIDSIMLKDQVELLKIEKLTVGDLFSNAMNQEQGNIEIVKCYSPSSFEALLPSGYNGFRTKVMKVIPS
jgi:Mg2+ and Co2+ transporter CorA